MKSERSRRLRYEPPTLGVAAQLVLRVMQAAPALAWPVPRLIDAAGLMEATGWRAVDRLMQLGLIERRSRDSFVRVIMTTAGRRYQLSIGATTSAQRGVQGPAGRP